MLTVKAGARYPVRWKTNFDLSGCTVSVKIKPKYYGAVEKALPATVEMPDVVRHDLDGTLKVGSYLVEVEVRRNTDIIYLPSDGFEELHVID